MEQLKKEIIRTLLYFDLFSFPLRLEEIHRFCRVPTTPVTIAGAMDELLAEKKIYRFPPYYLVRNREDWVRQREHNFRFSERKLQVARRNAALISRFPFVRGVAISGSLSKYSANEKADIDFFIITRARRLWICRSLLHAFKKLTFLAGRQHDFCMNYFLDEEELELKDKNFYTALESITIIPVFGMAAHLAFFQQNPWITDFFPNREPETTRCGTFALTAELEVPLPDCHPRGKRLLELLFAGWWGDRVNSWLRRLTIGWWRYKFRRKGFPMEYFDHDLRATPGESKYHPNDYQRRIIRAFDERIRDYEGVGNRE